MSNSILRNLANKGIGRKELVEAGFSGQKYDDVNRGKSNYKLEDIIKISEKFQLSCDYLMTGRERNPNSEILNENEKEMLTLFRALPLREQIKMIVRLEDLVNSNEAWKNLFRRLQECDVGVLASMDHREVTR